MDRNRKIAYNVLLAVETKGAYSNIALNDAFRKQSGDEAFVRSLVYGVIENQIYLDYKLSAFVKSGLRKVRPQALVLLRMGAYQIEFMSGVPDYAAIGETVELCKKVCRGMERFVNGVLRSYQREGAGVKLPDAEREPIRSLSVRYSCTEDIAALWIEMFGAEEAERLLAAGNGVPPLTVRVNRLKTDAEAVAEELRAEGFGAIPRLNGAALELDGAGVLSSRAAREGKFSVQDISSMKMIEALDPKGGETVVDVCAAPGGKSLAAAERMGNEGRVIACDIYDHKLRLIRENAERLGIDIVETCRCDASCFESRFAKIADSVIVDVPCSGLGVIRRKPEIKLRVSREEIGDLAALQLRILENARRYLKPGGRLAYSTCTISQPENRGVIEGFLKKNRDFFIVEEKQLLPHIDSSDGFYFCVLQRSEPGNPSVSHG